MKLLALALTIFLGGSALFAQSLSEQKLIELKNAGVQNALIVKQIEKDGISFRMDADATIRLKQLGFSEDVLNALLNAGDKKPSSAIEDPVKALYAQGKYPELCDYLKSQLATNPTNYRLRTILIGALLKIDQQPAALSELEKLRIQSHDPASSAYIDRSSLLVSSWQKQQEEKKRLLTALQNYSYADADSAIDQLSASVMQKTILHMLIDSYAGMYQIALPRTERLQNISFTDKERIEVVKNKIADSETNYNSLMEKANWYAHGSLFYEPCRNFGFGTGTVSDYVDIVTRLARVAPLSPDVMDLVFNVAILSSKYEDLQALGDKILAARGEIRIPFEAYFEAFDVVIDTKLRTLSLQPPVSRHSEVKCPNLLPKSQRVNPDKLRKFVPFNLAFNQVRGISQNVSLSAGFIDRRRSYALSVDPEGVAPLLSPNFLLEKAAGAEAELQATRNVGLYILHVIGNPNVNADLVDPQKLKKKGNGSGFADALVALYVATRGNTALGAATVQMMADNKAQIEETVQKQEATWQAMLARDYSNLLDGRVFDGLDKLVEAP